MIVAYLAIAAKAEQIGWPIVHQQDLTERDANVCGELPDSAAFLWVLREAGTHIVVAAPELDPVTVEARLARIESVAGPCRYFWWDAGELAELGDVEEACFVLEDRVRELRHRRTVTSLHNCDSKIIVMTAAGTPAATCG